MSDTQTAITDQQRRISLIAILVVFMLGALDMTILSTATPTIVADLNGLELYAWVTTAYMLSSTVLVPIFGKLGDMYGRKRILLWGISIFLAGSVLCGMSGEFGVLPLLGDGMMQLIIFRAVKGVGGAALFTSAIGIVADLYPPMKRAKFMGLFGAIFALASLIGPTIGGLLTDHASGVWFGHPIAGWRWVFYANLPLGLIALYMVAKKMPTLNNHQGGKIDYLGASLLLLVFIPFLLALTWGGNRYAWDSAQLLGMFALSAVSLIAFIAVESRTPDAVMPLDLFKSRVFVFANLSSFILGMAFMGAVMFMPLYMQVVLGVDATGSGFAMLPLMGGLMFTSILSGRLVSKSGKYKAYMVGGVIILVAGVYLLTRLDASSTLMQLNIAMVVVGLGLGPSQSLINLIVQSAFPIAKIGVATSSTQFFRQVGNTVGVAIFGAVMVSSLATELPRQLPQMAGSGASMNMSQAQSSAMNPQAVQDMVRARFDAYTPTVEQAFAGDRSAASEVVGNPLLPDEFKAPLVEYLGSKSDSAVPNAQRYLAAYHDSIDAQVETAVTTIQQGTRTAFSNAITSMFSASLWICLIGLLITAFIPVISLGAHGEREAQA
ncbi:MAG: MDR family MFS transporter [Pseudomonadota bacterium]|nr:MFS transporter [Gammaproteobacteria bacterium]MEC8861117.1 MDR family MFS transporter [Pseudomonadota bacterium]HBN15353.1 MFS transporter [Pseudohongiella sp.]|tara:strand:+ start:703 stop:2520 length:1818 start_codon:yes stop_codon:yes gene_type:complete